MRDEFMPVQVHCESTIDNVDYGFCNIEIECPAMHCRRSSLFLDVH